MWTCGGAMEIHDGLAMHLGILMVCGGLMAPHKYFTVESLSLVDGLKIFYISVYKLNFIFYQLF